MSVIILDTDAGLDDAAAILLGKYSSVQPAYYICTEGNTSADGVVRNVSILNKYLGLSARIVRGCGAPDKEEGGFYGEDGLGNLSTHMMENLHISQEDIRPELTYEAFKKELLQYDHITYIAIGPLITLADLIQDQQIKNRIDKLYILGGAIRVFNSPDDTEFNFHENPEAVQKVLSSGLPLTLFPLDVSIQQSIDEQQIRELESTGKYPEFIDMFRFIKKQTLEYDKIDAAVLHDTLPVLYCAYPEEYELKDVNISCNSTGHLEIVNAGYKIHLNTKVNPSLLYGCLKMAFDPDVN